MKKVSTSENVKKYNANSLKNLFKIKVSSLTFFLFNSHSTTYKPENNKV